MIKKIVKTVLLALVCAFLLLIAYLLIVPYAEVPRGSGGTDPMDSAWMKEIDDGTLISDIAIPGTHDSGANYVQLAYFSRCQNSNVWAQLCSGFRYLDVRLGVDGEGDGAELILYHGFCKCRESSAFPWGKTLKAHDVIALCETFLQLNPSETIVFAVKHEHGDDALLFQQLLRAEIERNPDLWYLTDGIPTLGECRGKIVLMRRYDDLLGLGPEAGIPFFWGKMDQRDPSLNSELFAHQGYDLLVQDRYKLDAEGKWTSFTAGLSAPYSGDGQLLRLNFLSTNGPPSFGHPYAYAKKLNKAFLQADLSGAPNSWIIVDFADAALARKIYKLNLD